MSNNNSVIEKAANTVRIGLGFFGLLTVLAGVAILVWPGKSAMVVTAIFAIYAVIAGLAYLGIGIFSGNLGFGARFWRIAAGVLVAGAGIIALTNLQSTSAFFFIFMAVLIGVTWIYEGFVTIATMRRAPSKGWALFFGIISIIAGLTLVFASLPGAFVLWWAIGLSAIIYGIAQIIMAFRIGKI